MIKLFFTDLKNPMPLLQKIIKHRFFIPILLFVLIIPAFAFLLRPGIYWNMHDDMQLIRQLEMEKCLYDGQIPCRWTPDLGYGYGYPLFNFYPPLPYFVGQIFRFAGSTFVAAVKDTAILQIIFSGFAMYLLASSLFGPVGGLLSGLFYTYAPYHAVDIYVRGAMDEAWAAVFFPLIFYFSKKLIDTHQTRYLVGLSASFAGLLLSHNPMVLIFSPLVLLWSLFWVFISRPKKLSDTFPSLLRLFLSALLALGISAFFTLPVLFESKLVQIDSMFTNYYTYSIHFVSLFQLFISNVWGDGPSVWGPNDNLSFAIGYLHWLIPTICLLLLFVKHFKNKKFSNLEIAVVGLIFMAYFSAFMTHERSTFIWKIFTPLQKIQFPWRFLNVTEFLFSLSAGFLPLLIIRHKILKISHYVLFIVIIVLLIAINVNHFTPITFGPITDAQKFSGQAWTNQITGGIYDYLPKTAKTAPKAPAKASIDQIVPSDANYTLSGQKKGTDWQFFNLTLEKPSTVYLSVLAFPTFEITDNQQKINYQIEPELGRISLTLDAGQHQIYLKLRNTPIRTVSNFISFFSVLGVVYLILPKKWRKLT
jgi:hypothetical protein